MILYLTEWKLKEEHRDHALTPTSTNHGNVIYKTGKSKWGKDTVLEKRIGNDFDERYGWFDKKLLASVSYSHDSYSIANSAILGMELMVQSMCPKDFQLEPYLGLEEGKLDDFGGITEFFLIEDSPLTIDQVIKVFEIAQQRVRFMDSAIKGGVGQQVHKMEVNL